MPDGKWDAVIDTCGYVPRIVGQSARFLRDRADQYLFVSTISVYPEGAADPIDEKSPVATIEDTATEEISGKSYGPLKALCERMVVEVWKEDALIIRPGLIVGPWDKSDRFTYWAARIADGGDVLVPDRLDQPVQFIDVRDLAEWMVRLVESSAVGIFNATGPRDAISLGQLFETCTRETGTGSNLVRVPVAHLEERGVAPWTDLPLVNPYDGSGDAMSRVDISRALDYGLRFRPIERTIRDTLEWYRTERGAHPMRTGLSREREIELLAKLPEAILE